MKKTLSIPTAKEIGIAKVPLIGTVGILASERIEIEVISCLDFSFSRDIFFLEKELPSRLVGYTDPYGRMLSVIGETKPDDVFFVRRDVFGRQVEVICPNVRAFAYIIPIAWIS
jgi:hypothetical protein